jgi:hypothetical protein
MLRTSLAALIFAAAFGCSPLFAQDSSAKEPVDLKVELRSATGSNRFQLGEVIPLEVLISSSTPNRYLEPCKMFWESCFGYPTPVTFSIKDPLLLFGVDMKKQKDLFQRIVAADDVHPNLLKILPQSDGNDFPPAYADTGTCVTLWT